jgi:hypothetical protein
VIRDFQSKDQNAIEEIHAAQGFDYQCPDLSNPLFLVKKVREVDGKVVAAMGLRITAETFLLVDGTPYEKGRAIEELQPEVMKQAWDKGLEDCLCVVPPEIAENFAPVLERMGWKRDRNWPMYSRDIGG